MLSQEFYEQSPEIVARALLGCTLVRHIGNDKVSGLITETEAYLAEGDAASHSFRGKNSRNASMFARAGTLYVYKIYGIHHCINVATEAEHCGAAVLIRACTPLSGIQIMKQFRGKEVPQERLCSGPGNLAKSFGFTLDDDGKSFVSNDLYILPSSDTKLSFQATPRIGITKNADALLRFVLL